jgi:hypothetical protein
VQDVEQSTGHDLADPGSFAGVQGRRSVDYLLHNTQAQLVALGGQADFKASVIITASAIVSSIAASQIGHKDLKWAAITLMVLLVPALLSSMLAVFPKFPMHRDRDDRLPPHFNPLFFGHYAGITKPRYLEEMSEIVRDDGAIYRVIAADIYDQGVYLVRAKYRYLRVSYVCFIAAFLAGGIAMIVTAIVT